MPSGPNPILTASNTYIAVTNFAGYTGTGLSLRATDWVPLTTADESVTGQICVPVKIVAGSGGSGNLSVVGPQDNTEPAVGGPVNVGGVANDGSAHFLSVDTVGGLLDGKFSTTDLTGAAISFSSSGDNTVVAAVASETTKVYRLFLKVAGSTNLTIKNGAGTSLTGAMTFNAGDGFVFDFTQRPWFTTSANTAFIINSSAAVQVSGRVEYVTSG